VLRALPAPKPTPSPAAAQPSSPRILVIDWLRGLAVVLMILAHAYDSWLTLGARTGAAYGVVRHLSGLPSRLFLFLVGVSAAIVYERQIGHGIPAAAIRAKTAKRGLQVIGLALLFRLQEQILAGFSGGVTPLFRVDILNCIGASMLVLALLTTPRDGRPRVLAALAGAALFLALGPFIGPAHFPRWLPEPLTAYVGGQRPMAWFPLFPWAAWPLVGVAVGHLWLRHARDERGQMRTFIVTGVIGGLILGAVILVRAKNPYIIRYPSDLVQQMGPGAFFFRLGSVGLIALLGWVVTRLTGPRFSPLRQLGQTSLLIYWVHVEICYGVLTHPVQRRLGMAGATVGYVLLVLAMFALSVARTRHLARARARPPFA
jgi:uncharacterized membrane protein